MIRFEHWATANRRRVLTINAIALLAALTGFFVHDAHRLLGMVCYVLAGVLITIPAPYNPGLALYNKLARR